MGRRQGMFEGTRMQDTSHEEYVTQQFKCNLHHSNGNLVSQAEESGGYVHDFIKWIGERDDNVTSFMDAGCRTGYCLPHIQKAFPFASVFGIDVVPEFIEAARYVGKAFVMDMCEMKSPEGTVILDEKIDYVYCNQALEHCYDVDAAIAQLYRVTKKAIFLGLPLEGQLSFLANRSHYAHTSSTFDWLETLRDEDWQVELAERKEPNEHCSLVHFNLILSRVATKT